MELSLLLAGTYLTGFGGLRARAARALARDAKLLIDADGAMPSRNPEELATLFALLVRAARTLDDSGLDPGARD